MAVSIICKTRRSTLKLPQNNEYVLCNLQRSLQWIVLYKRAESALFTYCKYGLELCKQ
jgi:hypothetical protein